MDPPAGRFLGAADHLNRFDRIVMCWVGDARRGWLTRLVVPYTISGTIGLPWLIAGFVLGHPLLLAAVVFSSALVADLVKRLGPRQRPTHLPLLVKPLRSASFPSGHAASSAAAACTLTMLAPSLAALWVVLALAMALSRVYVGVHYPTDILAGVSLGVLVFAALLAAAT